MKEEFKHETAGNLMDTNFPFVEINDKIRDAEKLLEKNKFEVLNYIYVVKKGFLVGVISVKDIFKNSKNTPIKEVMGKKVVSVRTHTDQERVAFVAIRNNLGAVPVVDKRNRILGVISSPTIFRILQAEGIEDVLRSAGVGKFKDPAREIIQASTFVHFKKRLPWLVVGLIGGIIAAIVVNLFEEILSIYILLAVFIPAVVYMADAVGSQSQTIFIRSMALDKELNYRRYSIRELRINLLLGAVLGLLFYFVALIGWKDHFFATILGLSILATVVISMGISILLPVIFNKMKFDPAISTGPFATAIRDLTSLMVYFLIAHLMIKVF